MSLKSELTKLKEKAAKKMKSWKPVGRKKHEELDKRYEKLI